MLYRAAKLPMRGSIRDRHVPMSVPMSVYLSDPMSVPMSVVFHIFVGPDP